jgi:hypothetical protein
VDGWVHDGKLYLRVVDYKTGRKKFDLSDVWYGMGLQMLLYLFTLEKNGRDIYGMDIVPAGVLYVPARDAMLLLPPRLAPTRRSRRKRAAALRRSGLVLAQPEVLEAMEHGDAPRYIPVKFKNGAPSGDALATAEGFGQLWPGTSTRRCGAWPGAQKRQHSRRPILPQPAGERLRQLRLFRRLPLFRRRVRREHTLHAQAEKRRGAGTC